MHSGEHATTRSLSARHIFTGIPQLHTCMQSCTPCSACCPINLRLCIALRCVQSVHQLMCTCMHMNTAHHDACACTVRI